MSKYDRHGSVNTPTYNSWKSMKSRCLNPNAPHYEYYGGLGIKIYDKWLGVNGFRTFREDLGERPEGMTLDRIDVRGDYTPENCRWADSTQQRINQKKRSNSSSPYKGVSLRKQKNRNAWTANITINQKHTYIGIFDTPEKAAIAYNEAAIIHHGKYASLNQVV